MKCEMGIFFQEEDGMEWKLVSEDECRSIIGEVLTNRVIVNAKYRIDCAKKGEDQPSPTLDLFFRGEQNKAEVLKRLTNRGNIAVYVTRKEEEDEHNS